MSKPMTREEAVAEAQRRWGGDLKSPWVRWFREKGERFFQVGYDHITHGRFRCGTGPSFEAAFRDADQRGAT